MAKRFSATELWKEDWFLDMPNEYKLYWFYMLATCDHGGFFRVNTKSFCALNKVRIDTKKALKLFNFGKCRIRPVREGFWFIEDFIHFQYGSHLNHKNNLHKSVLELLIKFNINVLSVRGVKEVLNGSVSPQFEVKGG